MKYNQPLKYKEICKEMDDEVLESHGSSRIHQFKRWQKEYEIEKVKTYYFVKRQLTDEEKYIKLNEGKLTDIIKKILLWYLNTQPDYKIYITYDELFSILAFVNKEYHKARFNKANEVEKFDYKSLAVMDESEEDAKSYMYRYLSIFFDASERVMKDTLNYVLKKMQSENMMLVNKGFKFDKKIKVYDEETKKEKYYWKESICSPQEISDILTIQNTVLKNHGLSSNEQVYGLSYSERNDVFTEMNNEISRKFNCDSYSKILILVLGKEVIKSNCENMNLDFIISNKNMVKKLMETKNKNMLILPDKLKDDFIREYNKVF